MVEQQVGCDIANIACWNAGFGVDRDEQVQHRTEEERDVEADKDQQDFVHFGDGSMVERDFLDTSKQDI